MGTPPPDTGENMSAPAPEVPAVPAPVPAAPPQPPANDHPDFQFPDNTPWRDMTAVQQAEYWRHQARKHEGRATARGDYDDVKAERDRLKAASLTPDQKAIEEARTEGRAAARRELGAQSVDIHVRALAAAGRLTDDAADVILDSIDRTKYLTAEGEFDPSKLAKYLDVVAPNGAPAPGNRRDPHQGNRQGTPGRPSGLSAGADMFANRRKPTPTP